VSSGQIKLSDGTVGDAGICKGCGEGVVWIITKNGKRAPMNLKPNEDNRPVSHFATCPMAKRFRQPNWK
jgi:hypothetical protein